MTKMLLTFIRTKKSVYGQIITTNVSAKSSIVIDTYSVTYKLPKDKIAVSNSAVFSKKGTEKKLIIECILKNYI
jgi:hypothetical protein